MFNYVYIKRNEKSYSIYTSSLRDLFIPKIIFFSKTENGIYKYTKNSVSILNLLTIPTGMQSFTMSLEEAEFIRDAVRQLQGGF